MGQALPLVSTRFLCPRISRAKHAECRIGKIWQGNGQATTAISSSPSPIPAHDQAMTSTSAKRREVHGNSPVPKQSADATALRPRIGIGPGVTVTSPRFVPGQATAVNTPKLKTDCVPASARQRPSLVHSQASHKQSEQLILSPMRATLSAPWSRVL